MASIITNKNKKKEQRHKRQISGSEHLEMGFMGLYRFCFQFSSLMLILLIWKFPTQRLMLEKNLKKI